MKLFFRRAGLLLAILWLALSILLLLKPGASIFYFRKPILPHQMRPDVYRFYTIEIPNKSKLFSTKNILITEEGHFLHLRDTAGPIQPEETGVYLTAATPKSILVYFSPTDGSDPHTSDKLYVVYLPLTLLSRPLGGVYLLALLSGLGCFLAFFRAKHPALKPALIRPGLILQTWDDFLDRYGIDAFIQRYNRVIPHNPAPGSQQTLRGAAVLTAAVLLAIILRINMMRAETGQADEPVYLRAAVLYASALNTGNLQEIAHTNYNFEHPIFNKLLYGAALSVFQPLEQGESWLHPVNGFEGFPLDERVQVLRGVSAFFGTLGVFLLGCIHPVAGLFLALQTFAVRFTSVIYLESVAMALSLGSVWVFSKLFTGKNSRKKTLFLILGSGFCLGAAAASKYIYGTAGIACLLYGLLKSERSPQKLLHLLLWGLTAGLFFVICDPFLWPDPLNRLLDSLRYSQNYSSSGHVDFYNFPFWQPLNWLTRSFSQHGEVGGLLLNPSGDLLKLDTPLFLLALLGLPILIKQKPLYFVWLVVDLLFLFIWKTKWPQYIVILLAPYCLSAAYGLEWMGGWLKRLWVWVRS